MRLIDADALLENYDLKNAVKYGNKDRDQQYKSYDTLMMYEVANMIHNAPTIESPRPDWTPCAEGLPTPEQAVIDHDYQKFFVTLQNLDGKRFIERCAYRCERWWMFDFQCYADETNAIALAWMPCPNEPYNPDRKEDADHIVDVNKKIDQVCPKCNSMAHYDPHFGRVMCRQCGWMQED